MSPIVQDPADGGGGGGGPGPFSVEVSTIGPGSATPPTQSVSSGASATITISPSTRAVVKSITLDGVPVAPDTNLTITGVVADHSVAVTFAPLSGTTVYSMIPEGGTLKDANMAGSEPPKWRPSQYADAPEPPAPTTHMGRRRSGRPWESPKSQ